jgi:hypothetical protein
MRAALERLPAAHPGRTSGLLWLIAAGALLVGLGSWGSQTLQGGVIALWAFSVSAVALALVLPLPYALVSPLFMGVAGWMVDMLPFVILLGWTAVVLRWVYGLLRERRLPRGGRWIWLPIGLLFWTGLGILVITSLDFKHFLLLLGIQFVATGAVLAVVDQHASLEARSCIAAGLVGFISLLSVGVFLQWIGVPIQDLQASDVRRRVEIAYGVDAFPNSIGMIKYARSINAGSAELNRALDDVREAEPDIPTYEVFRPRFQAYENQLVVRFEGSARPFEAELQAAEVDLLYDNVGLAPANTVPRLRSFPRNALTYAGACAAVLPFALFLAWTGTGRRRLLGRIGTAACLFGAAFSLARGAWVAIFIGIVYLFVDGALNRRLKVQFLAAYLAAALVLTGVFYVKYGVDPVTGRAGGGASVATRDDLYRDTISFLNGKFILLGYGTAQPRTESGSVREGEGQRYVPRAGTHSTYLNYLFRLGLPGGLGILALYLIAGLHARAASRQRDGDEQVFAAAAAVAVVITGAHATILSLYVEPVYTLVIMLVLGLAMAGNERLDNSVIPWRRAVP